MTQKKKENDLSGVKLELLLTYNLFKHMEFLCKEKWTIEKEIYMENQFNWDVISQ